jgi:integrase
VASYFEPGRRWRFDFVLYKQRHRAPRGFRIKALCDAAERALRDRLMAKAAGIPEPAATAPSFTRWASITYDYAVTRKHLSDPASFDRNLRQILRFWGDRPSDPSKIVKGATYHGLRLDAPIRDGGWLLKFEQWMEAQGWAGSTKNHRRSACSRLYAVAMAPEYRQQTGITQNPFVGIPRDPTRRREEAFTREQVAALFAAAPPTLRTAMLIALLAPALRIGNIVGLRWTDIQGAWIRVASHKTAGRTRRSLVSPIVPALAAHLATLPREGPYVVQEFGWAVSQKALGLYMRKAVEAIGLRYGPELGAYSFHSLRHTAQTLMAEMGIGPEQRKEAVGHLTLEMAMHYTHLTPLHRIAPLTQFADSLSGILPAPPAAMPSINQKPLRLVNLARRRRRA